MTALFKPATASTVAKVLRAMADQCDQKEGKQFRREYARGINVFLDELDCEDFFGTEGQCDPRGDHRD